MSEKLLETTNFLYYLLYKEDIDTYLLIEKFLEWNLLNRHETSMQKYLHTRE